MKKLRQSATAKQTGQGQANHFWRELRSYATRPNKYHVTFSNENIFYRMKIFLPHENIPLNGKMFHRMKTLYQNENYFYRMKYFLYQNQNIFYRMEIYILSNKNILSNENIFLTN